MKRCKSTHDSAPLVLPPELIALAIIPLPTSYLFHEASRDADALDESELNYWDIDPPFFQPEPVDTAEEQRLTKNLADVMIGRRVRLENETRIDLAKRYKSGDRELLVRELREVATRMFREWVKLKDKIAACTARRHKEMAESLLQWCARIVYWHQKDADMIDRGENPY